ncbi:MAG TPA: hypothetical protein VGC54_05070 [Planctomycetota bacterium]
MANRLQRGDPAPQVFLPRAGQGDFDSAEMKGRRWLLSFHRYAT